MRPPCGTLLMVTGHGTSNGIRSTCATGRARRAKSSAPGLMLPGVDLSTRKQKKARAADFLAAGTRQGCESLSALLAGEEIHHLGLIFRR